jgi:hypothetical protein
MSILGGIQVETRSKFQRTFLIFNQEDKGFGAGQDPSGYVKIEVRGNKGKLFASLQNINEEHGKLIYKLYLIRCASGKAYAACAGKIPISNRKGELNWEFDAENVGMTGIQIEKFDVYAVIVEYIGRENTGVTCPLAAYKKGKIAWRNAFKEMLYASQSFTSMPPAQNIASPAKSQTPQIKDEPEHELLEEKAKSKIQAPLVESKYIAPENKPEFNIPAEAEKKFNMYPGIIETEQEAKPPQEKAEIVEESNPAKEIECEEKEVLKADKEVKPGHTMQIESSVYMDEAGNIKYNEVTSGGMSINCLPGFKNVCPMYQNNIGPNAVTNPCAGCMSAGSQTGQAAPDTNVNASVPPAGTGDVDINKLMNDFDMFFERDDPFKSKRSDYKWWKVSNPVQLNNILYQNNVRSSILFNPSLMMAHFKYRHLIIGFYIDKFRRREYMVCGVPGAFNVDERPFGNMCRWVQLGGNRPRYGAFGYWLVYIEPKTGKLLRFK